MDKYTIVKNIIAENRCDEVRKEDLLDYANKIGLEIPKRISRVNLVNTLFETDKENFFQDFYTKIYVPEWILKDYWKLTTKDFENLKNIGFFDEKGIKWIKKEYYQRSFKEYNELLNYHGLVFDINMDEVKKIVKECSSSYPIRINTATKSEITELIQKLSAVFEITTTPNTYEKRDKQGYYTYFSVHPVNGGKYEKNRYLDEIEQLKKVLERKKEKEHLYQGKIEQLETILCYCFEMIGIDFNTLLSLKQLLIDDEIDKLLEEIEKLRKNKEK